jgi:hypothetical protein
MFSVQQLFIHLVPNLTQFYCHGYFNRKKWQYLTQRKQATYTRCREQANGSGRRWAALSRLVLCYNILAVGKCGAELKFASLVLDPS